MEGIGKEFYLFKKGFYDIWIWKNFDEQFLECTKKDQKSMKKVTQWIERLAERIPNMPEQIKTLKDNLCNEYEVFELKPKPYRVVFVKIEEKILLIVAIWKKTGNKLDSEEIKKACALVKELVSIFKKEAICY